MIKTASFGVMHIVVAFLVVWAMTGDWMIGGAVALVEPLVNTVAYHFHEKVWLRIRDRKGREGGGSDDMLAA
ncbi:MAG: DUF2061 domain-containing protein [Alcanivorax sp.]|uniref:DUF2061 domain-containing protein n=1 Tax=Alcanivorax limicola TaxID=2874102 RepID=UPI001CBA754F|nr:DUF2061 domain-containing protein [Alcanivorax limicola]MBZ2189460.1 DUF2061 domain-containing protein [Alcanivorax limicola]MCH8544969.1 DUF2061 domain-containing protein [Alcanivorax sp.]